MRERKELLHEAQERRAEQAGRIAQYGVQVEAYLDQSESGANVMVTGSTADARPVLRAENLRRGMRRIRRGAPNFVRPVVDAFVNLRGPLPLSTVKAKDATPQELEAAKKRTRILRWQHDISRLELQQPRGAFYLSSMGDMLYLLEPLTPARSKELNDPFKPPGIYITVVNPSYAYPRFGSGSDAQELEDVFLAWTIDPRTALTSYGVRIAKDDWLTKYYSRTEQQVFVGDVRVEAQSFEHKLGFVPAQWVANKPSDGRFAQADIAAVVEMNKEAQAMYYMISDATAWAVYPLIEVRNPLKVRGEKLTVGPGAKVETMDNGAVLLHTPAANPEAGMRILDMQRDNMTQVTGMSPIRIEGQVPGSNISSKAVRDQQSPLESGIALRNIILGAQLERLNSKILLMLSNIDDFRHAQLTMYGDDEGTRYAETYSGDDVGGWHMNSVKWHPLLGMGISERVHIALMLQEKNLISDRKVLEEYGEDDPESMLREAQADALSRAQMQAQMQQAMQPPQPGGPPPGAEAGGPPGAGDGGGTGGAVPPPPNGQGSPVQAPPQAPPGFPPMPGAPNNGGQGSATSVPDVIAALQQALQRVAWSGPPGQVVIGQGVVTVVGVEQRDRAKVNEVLKPLLAQLMPGVQLKIEPPTAGVQR